MPTIYTEDPVGKAVEDHYLGTQGVFTGSPANSIGLAERERQQTSKQSFSGVGHGRFHSGSQSYEMRPLSQSILNAIPRWLYIFLAVIGGVCGFVAFGAAVPGQAGPYVTIGLGAFAGWVILPLLIVICDIVVQLTWALLKIAFVLGVIAAIFWGITLAVGS